ncbi:hypothetical protein NIES4071_54260 [Calothrix sp. NIES-4071]|nr:hypothetical protein NIES4071_54260 [Calothrix sp. NIES-4071]BAZ59734.1 hypothetical protein NIES4105_54210 [Calothrix sp. NIES-4105]
MKELKVPTSKSYKEYLISSLKDDIEAAAYIETFLELGEDGYDANVLRSALEEVVDARKELGTFSLSVQQHHEKLDKILAKTGGDEILTLIEFLDALGYKISIVAKDEKTSDTSD